MLKDCSLRGNIGKRPDKRVIQVELRFWNDPETGLPHIYAHGVSEREVQQVLSRPGLNLPGGGNSRSIMGQTSAGRYLKVVFVPDVGGDTGFVVTAYELRGKALRAYRRAIKRKKR
jgi:hypothetical protein